MISVTIYGGPNDGKIITINEGVHTVRIPELSSSMHEWAEQVQQDITIPMPTMRIVDYHITPSPHGLVAVRDSISRT